MDKILELIREEDLPDGCKDLVEVLGMDVFVSLVEYCGGSNVYIPSKGSIVNKSRNRVIRDEFDGGILGRLQVSLGLVRFR